MNKKNGVAKISILICIILCLLVSAIVISNISSSSNSELSEDNVKKNDSDDFLITIEDVFFIDGSGTVVTGKVLRGQINKNDEVEIVGLGSNEKKTKVSMLEMFRKEVSTAKVGESVGVCLSNVSKEELERGQVLAKVGSIKSYTKFDAVININKKDDKGNEIKLDKDALKVYCRTKSIDANIVSKNGDDIRQGTDINVTVTLKNDVAMEVGNIFDIRQEDYGKNIGTCVVTKVYE